MTENNKRKKKRTYHMYFKSRHTDTKLDNKLVKQLFTNAINQALEIYNFDCIAYLVSNDFFHFIIKTLEQEEILPQIVRYIQITFEDLYNKEMNQTITFHDQEFTHTINEIHI